MRWNPSFPALALFALFALFAYASALAAGETVVRAGSDLVRLPAAERTMQVEARFRPTPVAWPAGRQRLTDVVALLERSGNATALHADCDGGRTLDLPAHQGTYWSALAALCAAYDLTLAPGPCTPGGPFLVGGEQQPVVVQGGRALLEPRRAARSPRYLAGGAVLVELADLGINQRQGGDKLRWIDCLLRLRFEPRVDLGQVDQARLAWEQARAAGGRLSLDAAAAPPPAGLASDHVLVQLVELPERLPAFDLTGRLQVRTSEALAVNLRLLPGASARIDLGEHAVQVRLLGADHAKAENRAAPCLIVTWPPAAFAREPRIELAIAGKAVTVNGQSVRNAGGTSERILSFTELVDGEHEITLAAAIPLADCALPVAVAIDLAGLPREAAPPPTLLAETATAVAWPAAATSLRELVRRLNQGGNTVVVDLGVDEQQRQDLPAFTGTFWQATLEICRRFDLVLLPPPVIKQTGSGQSRRFAYDGPPGSPAVLGCGAVRLGRARATAKATRPGDAPVLHAAGPLLVEVLSTALTTSQRLNGVGRQAELTLRLRLEPRIDEALVTEPVVTWATVADAGGTALEVTRSPANPVADALGNLGETAESPRPLQLTVNGLPPQATALRLHGQVQFKLRRPLRQELVLAPGERAQLVIGGRTLAVMLSSGDQGEKAGVKLTSALGVADDLQVTLRGATGNLLRNLGRSTGRFNREIELTWLFEGVTDARHTVVITARETLATPCLPVVVEVPLP